MKYTVHLECSNGNVFETVVEAISEQKAVTQALFKMPSGFTATKELLDVPEIKSYVNGVLSLGNW